MTKRLDKIFNIEGKVVVVTGAAGLLGRQHVEAIVSFGGTPILIDLNLGGLESLKSHIKEKYKKEINCFKVDITKEEEVIENVNKVNKLYGKIDGLVNNAANNPKVEENNINNLSRLEHFPLETWNQDINVGLTGAFICSKHFGKTISENPDGGVIVNISSDLGLIAPNQKLYQKEVINDDQQPVKPVTYSVVKSGLIGLTRYLSTYWIDKGVRCNAICPGGVENGQDQEFLDKVSSLIPMNRLARPEEYQGTLIWMLSDASTYLNGAIVPVEGGRSAW